MKQFSILLVFLLIVGACADGSNDQTGATTTTVQATDPSPEILAAAILELITENHTFGEGPPPFTEFLLQTHLDPTAGDPTAESPGGTRPLSEAERVAIEAVVAPFGPVRWIDDPAEWITSELSPTTEGAVILGVGEPEIGDGTALVRVSLWCGGLCGTWLSYRINLTDAGWIVVGVEGPIVMS